MDAVGSLCVLLISIAALAALGGYIAGILRERNKRRVGRYFVLGVVTGFVAAVVSRRRLDRLVPAARGSYSQRFDSGWRLPRAR